MPPAKKRRSPLDRFTDASPTAISAGFSAAMSLGPQPKPFGGSRSGSGSGGVGEGLTGGINRQGDQSWVQGIRDASGLLEGGDDGTDDDGSDADAQSSLSRVNRPRKQTKKRKTAAAADEDANIGSSAGATLAEDMTEEEQARNRKAQNRIAQREFRQRKQQYIRALEARVELLSSDHDTQVDRLRYALRGLLAENNTLRNMLGSLAHFIGERTLGGPLQQSGISRDELLEMIDGRSEKTMTDAWQNWPGAKECEALRQIRQEANIPPEGLPDMRNSPGPSSAGMASASKKGKKGRQLSTVSGNIEAGTTSGNEVGPANPAGSQQQPQFSLGSATNSSVAFVNPAFNQMAPAQPIRLQDFMSQPSLSFPQTPPTQQQSSADDGIMAGLFGSENFYYGLTPTSQGIPGMGGVFDANQLQALHQPQQQQQQPQQQIGFPLENHGNEMSPQQLTGSTPRNSGLSAAGTPTNGGDNDGSGITYRSASSAPSSAPTPKTAFQKNAMQFLSSLRSVDKTDDVDRLNAIAERLIQLRAAQGRLGFHPLGADLPSGGSNSGGQVNSAADTTQLADMGGPMTEEEMHRMTDACIQVAYHMSNYRRNASYRLPALLRPTDLQLTRPHDPIVDTIPFSGLRDAIILNHDKINMDDLMFDFFDALLIDQGDVYVQSTWMLSHSFVVKYPFLATPDVIDATNRWRRVRGMGSLSPEEIKNAAAMSQDQRTAPPTSTSASGSASASIAPAPAPAPVKTSKPRGRPRKTSPRYRPPGEKNKDR